MKNRFSFFSPLSSFTFNTRRVPSNFVLISEELQSRSTNPSMTKLKSYHRSLIVLKGHLDSQIIGKCQIFWSQLPDLDQVTESDDDNSTEPQRRFYVNDIICRIKTGQDDKIIEAQFGSVSYPINLESNEKLENILRHGFDRNFTVFWFQSREKEIVSAKDKSIFVVERNFQLGMKAKRGNLMDGHVVGISTKVTLKIVENGRIISNVPLNQLQPVYQASVGDYVMKREWIGVVTQVNYCASLIMENDPTSECHYRWSVTASENLQPEDSSQLKSRIIYPGQAIQLSQSEILNQVEWISPRFGGKWRSLCSPSFMKATINSINTVFIVSNWLYQVPTDFHEKTAQPPSELTEDFINLNHNMPLEVSIGSLRKIKIMGGRNWDYHSDYESWLQYFGRFIQNSSISSTNEQSSSFHHENGLPNKINLDDGEKPRKIIKVHNSSQHEESLEELNVSMWKSLGWTVDQDLLGKTFIVQILAVTSWPTVCWSTVNRGVEMRPSWEFEPILMDTTSPRQFPPASVVTFAAKYSTCPHPSRHYGVVMKPFPGCFDSKMRVRWFQKLSSNNNLDSPKFIGESLSSWNDLELHPLFNLGRGTIVIGNELCSFSEQGDLLIGIFQGMMETGMYNISLLNNHQMDWTCWPDNVFKLPVTVFFDCRTQDWHIRKVESGSHLMTKELWSDHVNSLDRFSPSIEILGKNLTSTFSHEIPQDNQLPVISNILNEICLLNGGQRPGIWIKTIQEDILSVVIEGPNFTPYEDALFFFTVKIPDSFPNNPPQFNYHSYSSQVLNPCLLLNGKVLLPMLNTYPVLFGHYQQEKWDPTDSSLGLILMCIQKLILCSVPQDREPNFGLWKLVSTKYCRQVCLDKNLNYLEQVIQSVYTQLENPPTLWRDEMFNFYICHIPKLYNRLMKLLKGEGRSYTDVPLPNPIPIKRIRGMEHELLHLMAIYNQTYQII